MTNNVNDEILNRQKYDPKSQAAFSQTGHRFTNQRASIWQLFSTAPHGYTIRGAAGVLTKEGIGHAKATGWNYMGPVPNAGRPCRRMDLYGRDIDSPVYVLALYLIFLLTHTHCVFIHSPVIDSRTDKTMSIGLT
jgi:hypothetical protein